MSNQSTKLAVLLAAATALAAPAFAEEDRDKSDRDEVIVTGSRTPIDIKKLGSSVSVIDAETIEARHTPIISDLLRDVPGLAVARSGPRGTNTSVRIRGAEANHTQTFIDGIEVNDPALDSQFDFGHLLSYDIDRVEILRGAQSALYGSDAIGGVVNILTKTPETGFDAFGEVQGGSFGTYQFGAGMSGGTDFVKARGSLVRFKSQGVSISPQNTEDDGYENVTAHTKLIVSPTENTEVSGVFRFTEIDLESDLQDFGFLSPTQGLVIDSDNEQKTQQLYARVQGDLDLFDGMWTHRAAFGLTDTASDFLAGGTFSTGNRGKREKLEYQTTVTFGLAEVLNTVTFAVEHEDLEFQNIGTPSIFGDPNQFREDEQTSFVGEYRAEIFDRLFLTGSVRRDQNDLFDDATTYRGTLAYIFPSSGTRIHGSYGTGVKNPNFFELFGFTSTGFIGNPNLTPEKSKGFDVGITQPFFNGRATIDMTYFQQDLTDEITTSFVGFFTSPVNLTGESERKGMEVALDAEIFDDFTVGASYTYTDSEQPDGQPEVRRAKHIASVNAGYAFCEGRGLIDLNVQYNGEREDSEFIAATPATRVTLDDYVLVNLAASYDVNENVELFVKGDNLANEDYQDVFGFNTPGAAVFGGIRVGFGSQR